jgi:hypothetical protein
MLSYLKIFTPAFVSDDQSNTFFKSESNLQVFLLKVNEKVPLDGICAPCFFLRSDQRGNACN